MARRPPASCEAATAALLARLGAAGSPQGMAALTLARVLDAGDDSAAGLASASRELRAVLADVAASAPKTEGSRVDDLAKRRDRRRATAAGQ